MIDLVKDKLKSRWQPFNIQERLRDYYPDLCANTIFMPSKRTESQLDEILEFKI